VPELDFLLQHDESFRDNFCANMNQLRRLRRWTQDELAQRVGISRLDIGLIERGKKRVTLELAERICRALNVRLAYLVGEERLIDETGLVMMVDKLSTEKRLRYKALIEKVEAAEALKQDNTAEANRQLFKLYREVGTLFGDI